jgi:hypothetical protein
MQLQNNQNSEQPNVLPIEAQPTSNPAPNNLVQPSHQVFEPTQPTGIPLAPQSDSSEPVQSQPVVYTQPLLQPQPTPVAYLAMPISQNTIDAVKPKRRIPRWLKILLGVITALATLVAIAIVMYLSSFETVTYEEDSGTTFKIKYYKNAILKPAADFVHSEKDFPFHGSDFLVQSSGKYPLAIQINKHNTDSLYTKDALCADPAFKLNQAREGQSDVVCHLYPGNHQEILYLYEYKSGGDRYLVSMIQHIEALDNPPTDPQEAQELSDKILNDPEYDLRNFNEDLQIILPSIAVDE